MDPSQWWMLIALIVLIVASAFLSAGEAAYSAASRVRLRSLEASGDKRTKNVLRLLDKSDRLRVTLAVCRYVCVVTAATVGTMLFTGLMDNKAAAAAISAAAVCAAILLAALVGGRQRLAEKIFKIGKSGGVTEDELITMVEAAHTEGGIDEHESQLIRSAIEFEDMEASDIMVPRVNVVAVDESASVEEIAGVFAEHGYSRLPVYRDTIDTVIGILHEKDLFSLVRQGKTDIHSVLQNAVCVSENMKISAVLRLIQKARVHMAMVVDEFGGTSGIVTLEDILEELVGEIWDEHDEVEVLYKKVGENTFLVSGSENLEDMFEELGVHPEEEFDVISVGGWVTERLERIPKAGEQFSYENLDITVTKANVRRVLEVRVKVNDVGGA